VNVIKEAVPVRALRRPFDHGTTLVNVRSVTVNAY